MLKIFPTTPTNPQINYRMQYIGCEEMPAELTFRPANEMPQTPTPTELSHNRSQELIGTPPDPPFYMTVRVDRRRKRRRRKPFTAPLSKRTHHASLPIATVE